MCRAVDHHAPLSIITVHRPVCALNCHCGLGRCGDIEPDACSCRYSGYSGGCCAAAGGTSPPSPATGQGSSPPAAPTNADNPIPNCSSQLLQPDDAHPTITGQQVLATAIQTAITTYQPANAQQREQAQKLKIMSRWVE